MLTLAFPAGVVARTVAPPGLPEAEQYYETLPTSTGPRAPDATKKAHDAVLAGALGEESEHALRHHGPVGLSLATAVAQTAEVPAKSQSPSLASLGDQGLGGAFLLLLALMALAAATFAVARRRHSFR